tara:strand:+ start:971 stop:1240 length:270 start_codon:yes stop_codon:yes gene_type:complete
MLKSNFNNSLVDKVSISLQKYMKDNCLKSLSADECATLLAKNNILTNTVKPKPGFNFRQMLRDGRDGKINLVEGAFQERPNTKWSIKRK